MGERRQMRRGRAQGFALTFSRAGEANRAAEIDHDDLVEALRKETCAVVDVREAGEFASGHIPGAINLPLSRFDPEELPTDKPVVLVCQSGGRSAKALQRALAAGISNICHYRPGTTGWRAQGGPTLEGG
jgi:rhodanese-related sulfurtransferase